MIWGAIWGYDDAERRGKPGWAAAPILLCLSRPLGLLLQIRLRPESMRYPFNRSHWIRSAGDPIRLDPRL